MTDHFEEATMVFRCFQAIIQQETRGNGLPWKHFPDGEVHHPGGKAEAQATMKSLANGLVFSTVANQMSPPTAERSGL